MPSATTGGLHPPRIYCINVNVLTQHESWQALLTHVAAMHFNMLLLSGNSALALHAQLESDSSCATLENFCSASAQAGLGVLLDVEIDRFSSDHPLALQHTDSFFCEPQDTYSLPDPRFHTTSDQTQHAQLRLDADGTQLALNYWHAHFARLMRAGVSGFRCIGIARIAPAIWRALIAEAKKSSANTNFFAWTPGCSSEQLQALQPCGFDGVFSSDAWWDYRSSWLAEEHQRLSRLGLVIAAPEDPNGTRLRCGLHTEESTLLEAAYRRALLSAAGTGDGLLLTAGFEYCSDRHLEHADIFTISNTEKRCDLSNDIAHANQAIASHQSASSIYLLSSPGADIALVLRCVADAPHAPATLLIINTHLGTSCTITGRMLRERTSGWDIGERLNHLQATVPGTFIAADSTLTLPPGEVQFYAAQASKKVQVAQSKGKQAVQQVTAAAHAPRIAIENITPRIDEPADTSR